MPTSTLPRRRAIVEARRLWQRVLDGDLRARADVMETLTTSDFPVLLGNAYGRELLQEYTAAPAVWRQFATPTTVPNFKPKKFGELLGGRAGLDKVAQSTEYKARGLTEAEYSFQVGKYGNRIPLTWEMLVDDDLDAFRNLPNRLAIAARETEDRVAVEAFLNANKNGLNTQFFKAANGNAPTNLPLTRENLENALSGISQRKDSEGRPILTSGRVLMVPSTLEIQARRILDALEVRRENSDGTTTVERNSLSGLVTLVVNPWLTVINTGAAAATTWFVLPVPTSPRPAVVVGFLRGNEQPDLRVKADAGNRVGGGAVAPEEGSFDDDTIQYRVRHVTGSSPVVPTETYASTGTAG